MNEVPKHRIAKIEEVPSVSPSVDATGSTTSTVKYEHEEERKARLELEKLQLQANLEKEKAERDSRLDEEKLDKADRRQRTKIRFIGCWAVYGIGFLIVAGLSVWGDANAVAWARPALVGMLGVVAGYVIGKTDKD